ncbi:MAG: DUF1844 domain-containing protein [Verrucomicrobiota bacterium]
MFGLGKKEGSQESKEPESKKEQASANSEKVINAQRFVEFIMMQAQNILFVLGQMPTPDGRSAKPNLETGKVLFDQLELIRIKTKGNLSKQESQILDDAIESVSMAFTQASGGTPPGMMPSRTPDIPMPDFDEEELVEESPPASEPIQEAHQEEQTEKNIDENEKRKFFKSYG